MHRTDNVLSKNENYRGISNSRRNEDRSAEGGNVLMRDGPVERVRVDEQYVIRSGLFQDEVRSGFDRHVRSVRFSSQRLKRGAAKVASINCFNFERVSSRIKSEASLVSAAQIAKLSMNRKMRNGQRPKMNF